MEGSGNSCNFDPVWVQTSTSQKFHNSDGARLGALAATNFQSVLELLAPFSRGSRENFSSTCISDHAFVIAEPCWVVSVRHSHFEVMASPDGRG